MHIKESQEILAPISLGELIDKITILQIKANHLKNNALDNVKTELSALETILNNLKIDVDPMLIESLKVTNEKLWSIEDMIRDHERQKKFDGEFISLARSIYQQNDNRSAIKRQINITYGSSLIEEKSYEAY